MIYKIEFTPEQLAIVSEALVAMPYARVAGLISELQTQIRAQSEKKEEAIR